MGAPGSPAILQIVLPTLESEGMSKEQILDRFKQYFAGTGGIDSWLTEATPDAVFERLSAVDNGHPLSHAQLNQLLVLSHEAGMSPDFFNYYWLSAPSEHPYDVTTVPGYEKSWSRGTRGHMLQRLDQLGWGLYRFYVDALLYFGNIRTAYQTLRSMTAEDLEQFFKSKRLDPKAMQDRGPPLTLSSIPKDDRYLISEMACKSYGALQGSSAEMRDALIATYRDHQQSGGGRISIRSLLEGTYAKAHYADRQQQLLFSADEMLNDEVGSEQDLETRYARIAESFTSARNGALRNTQLYLSMVDELDVYVATSMRTREDFRSMAASCEQIFGDKRLKDLNVRYFDPTLSAADGHEDKGLIECLMVKCAKALVYFAGEKESYGKDAEAAMALSQGKPVIFLCNQAQRSRFYRDVHPLSRLIDFRTGVPVGAMVTTEISLVSELLYRCFENKMEYEIERPKPGYLRLKERLTSSVVRLQTSDNLLRETFWNYYHNRK
jgi:hypothetical protein